PRFVVVETVEGVRFKTPLVWWRSATSLAEARAGRESAIACPPEVQCEEVISHSTLLHALVFFGDGNGEGRDATSTGPRLPLTAVQYRLSAGGAEAVSGARRDATRVRDHTPMNEPFESIARGRGRVVLLFCAALFGAAGCLYPGAEVPYVQTPTEVVTEMLRL